MRPDLCSNIRVRRWLPVPVQGDLPLGWLQRAKSPSGASFQTGDSHLGCAADESAPAAWWHHAKVDQNLWNVFSASLEVQWGPTWRRGGLLDLMKCSASVCFCPVALPSPPCVHFPSDHTSRLSSSIKLSHVTSKIPLLLPVSPLQLPTWRNEFLALVSWKLVPQGESDCRCGSFRTFFEKNELMHLW